MTICIFAGTFNPIHDGHLKMAEYALEKFDFEKIIFIPAYLPPHKEIDVKLAEHRYNMVKLAIQKNPRFEISDIEYKSGGKYSSSVSAHTNEEEECKRGKSYSLITVKKIIEQYCINGRLNFIIGTDAFAKIDTWYKAEELKELVHFIVFPRRGDVIQDKEGWDYELTDMDYIDVSSTEIRNGLKSNTSVEGYIKENGLYKI